MSKRLIWFVLVGASVLFAWFLFFRHNDTTNVEVSDNLETEQTQAPENIQEQIKRFDAEDLQSVVDEWVASVGGEVSVVIYNPHDNGTTEVVASYKPDKVYFAASLYKMFVVYAGYQSLDDGTFSADEDYLYDQSRLDCLDKAIRSSDSPCAETWWNELGKETITEQMQDIGIENTSLTGISTTARDSAFILQKIWLGEGLSDNARSSYLDSMLEQDALYRRGLPSGFSDEVTVYNKVGWNLNQEWHDASIVDFGEDRVLVIAVLSKNVGMKNIASLASGLEQSVVTNVD